ncbi:Uncharacterised protein (plasmid) [Tsukamurella tyrosinosolvens]|uniref:Uncharacterized protein n=1 Tax=Tsukamurella tyrosinosolvens TaxID=57704 RepID=A0A1H4TB20_TSUTY|nr:hypothetical protein [Tsukamurella tyrosinosolvens]KXO93246.1 hypothetical protein AXK58_15460 [Tsukamurella tyrosinosolvens]SEC53460.1 hypothetical protein SAMN04489793_2536 [Tsukamurella tyrosinosolvens]VEH89950.1 Uncharacterised protein [Tsukamurella tyrosinosolvens]
MIGVVIALLLAATVAGVLAARRGSLGTAGLVWAAAPAVLLGAAAAVALAAPAATGFGLAAVRVAAVLAAMAGGSALVTAAFALAGATGQDEPDGEPDRDAAPADDDPANGAPAGGDPADEPVPASPLRGGLAIGVLERAAIAVCVLANFGGGLAVIVAAKGLARYPELRHPGAAEQFIIGTFVSVLWAVACAGVAVAVGR